MDGQQRLTTTYLLLAAMRNYLDEKRIGADISASLQSQYLFKADRREGDKQRLTLNTDDKDFFRKLTDKERAVNWPPQPTRASHRLLKAAYFIAKQKVESLASSVSAVDAPETFNNWLDFLEQGAQVILLRAHDAGRAFKMFETLNDRGLKTSQADLVKSYLFGLCSSDLVTAQARWSSMMDNLQELDDDEAQLAFLRHYLIAMVQFVRADNVYEVVQNSVKTEGTSLSFLAQLSSGARTYAATFNSGHEKWQSYSQTARELLDDFNFLDLKPIRPVLLASAERFNTIEFEKSIRFLVNLSVRLILAARTRSGSNEQAFAEAALAIGTGKAKNHSDLVDLLEKIAVSDSEFLDIFTRARVTKANLARFYLRGLERFASRATEDEWVNKNPDEITLEHIAPKSRPTGSWPAFSEEQYEAYKHRLGNLCLLRRSENNGMPNESFQEKRKVLLSSSLTLTRTVAEEADWSPSTIDVRQAKLAALAVKVWSLG